MERFWSTPQGQLVRLRRRRDESVRLALAMEPPTKKTRPGTRAKAKAAVAAAFAHDLLATHARTLTNWPKPRAAIALEIQLFSDAPNGARVDSICKWLLDELAGHVYSDDRQVKLLFARASRSHAEPRWVPRKDSTAAQSWTGQNEVYAAFERLVDREPKTPREPKLYVTAQTRASVLADLRAVQQLDERWNPFAENHEDGFRHRDPLDAWMERERLVEFYDAMNTGSEQDKLWRRLTAHQIDYHDQEQQQNNVDLVFSSLLTELPVDRFGLWKRVRARTAHLPYIFDIGVLPSHGGSSDFSRQLRSMLEMRRERWPGLFPMRARSGVSMVLFEDEGSGKDLDNLIRTVLPHVLEVLRPQRHDLQGWVAEEADPAEGTPDVPFIEAVAIPARMTDMPPGSVMFGLSSPERYDSWWKLAAEHLGRELEGADDTWW